MTVSLRQNLADGLHLRSPLQVMFAAAVGLIMACLLVGLGVHLVQYRTPPGIMLDHLAEADALFAAGEFSAAVDTYRGAAVLAPDDLEALLRLHSAAIRAGDTENVWWALRRAVAIVPGDARVLYWLGEAYLDDNKPDAALVAYQRAFAASPFAEFAYKIGLVHQQQGRSAAAIEWFERALALDPDHANARTYLTMMQRSQQ